MINLMLGDCLERMKEIPDGSVDLVLADPPYGTTACSWDSIIPLDDMWAAIYRALRPNGFIVLTASQPFTTKLIASNINDFSHQWIWQKEQGSNPLLANKIPMKNFEDVVVFSNEYSKHDVEGEHPQRRYFKDILLFIGLKKKDIIEKIGQCADHCFRVESTQYGLCTKTTYNKLINAYHINEMNGFTDWESLNVENKIFRDNLVKKYNLRYPRTYNPQMMKGEQYTSGGGYIEHLDKTIDGGSVSDKRYPTSIIKFNTDKRKSVHPTQKPVALMEYLIKTYTNEGETVLDFTAGSFTTGVACVNLNRSFIGIEMDKNYFDIGVNRIKERIKCLNLKIEPVISMAD